jgi:hypothetical protein
MIKDSLADIGAAARALFRSRGALGLLCALYLALLAALYLFPATGVATVWQLALSGATAAAAPLLFFVLQAAAAHHAQGAEGFVVLLKRALRDFLKILLVSLPLVALALGLAYLLGKLGDRLPQAAAEAPRAITSGPGASPPNPLRGREALVSTLGLLVLGLFVPLMAAQAWLSVAREGLKATLKGFHRVLARAFAPRAVLVYAIGLVAFGLMPYFVIFTRTPLKNDSAELLVFGLRLGLAFVLTLWGWTITLGALARSTPPAPASSTEETPAPPAEETESVGREVKDEEKAV